MENYHFASGWQITKIPLIISACFTALHHCLTRGVLVQAWTNRVDRLLFSRQPVTRYADIFLLRFDFSKNAKSFYFLLRFALRLPSLLRSDSALRLRRYSSPIPSNRNPLLRELVLFFEISFLVPPISVAVSGAPST